MYKFYLGATMQNTLQIIKEFSPFNEQEKTDKQTMLNASKLFNNLLSRKNEFCHFTFSAFIINKQRTKVLCCFHNIYNSWSLPGGHADENDAPIDVAKKEAAEETGILNITCLSSSPIALDILTTDGHFKNGYYVSAHLHFNLCYLFEADQNQPIKPKPDENKDVRWLKIQDLPKLAREPQMKIVYKKIIQHLTIKNIL